MKEFTKYELYLFKAEAVKNVGNNVENQIKYAEGDIEYYQSCIESRIAEQKEKSEIYNPDDDWSIKSYRENIAKDKAEITIWQKVQKLLDKEMGE